MKSKEKPIFKRYITVTIIITTIIILTGFFKVEVNAEDNNLNTENHEIYNTYAANTYANLEALIRINTTPYRNITVLKFRAGYSKQKAEFMYGRNVSYPSFLLTCRIADLLDTDIIDTEVRLTDHLLQNYIAQGNNAADRGETSGNLNSNIQGSSGSGSEAGLGNNGTPQQSARPEQKPDSKPETEPETKPVTKPDTNPEIKPDTKPEIKPDVPTKPQEKPSVPNNGNQPGGGSGSTQPAFAQQVVNLVNVERRKAGLGELTLDKTIESAALVRAKETEISFSHTRPDGSAFHTALTQNGIKYRGSGENIAWGQKTPEAVMSAWMNSPGHKANILKAEFKNIGVGHYQNSSGVSYWTQLFTY